MCVALEIETTVALCLLSRYSTSELHPEPSGEMLTFQNLTLTFSTRMLEGQTQSTHRLTCTHTYVRHDPHMPEEQRACSSGKPDQVMQILKHARPGSSAPPSGRPNRVLAGEKRENNCLRNQSSPGKTRLSSHPQGTRKPLTP